MSQKVNLSEITNLVKRGREAYNDPQLVADILSIDETIVGDGFYYDDAQGDPSDDEFINHKNTWRNRVAKCAEVAEREVSIHWTDLGQMIVTLKPVKTKRKRK